MKELNNEQDLRIKRKNLGLKGFLTTYIIFLLLVGVQTGLIVSPAFTSLGDFWKINIIMSYWAIVAFIFCLITNYQIREKYELPMKRLSAAAKKVANGDFSIYIKPVHTPDAYDYIDAMFLDFNIMVKELGSIETLKNDFVSNVSHEIKTPLAIIKNYATSLKNTNLSAATRNEYISTISRATDKLSNLVTNILRLNKLENQEIEMMAEPFDVSRQLSECILAFDTLWEDKNIELHVDIEERTTINADKNLLEIVWNNLLSNAIKYTESGGQVRIHQTSDSQKITVLVADTGCGMNEETAKRIFDKFYQADMSRSTDGNGLGLTLAYRIIENLGGTLRVASERKKGSEFTVTIPVNDQEKEGEST